MTSSPARADAGPPQLETFRGLHYASTPAGELADVTLAPPALWDFAALGDLARAHDHHVLRLLSPSLTGGATAEATAAEWVATGALTVEPTPGLYRWQWSQQGRSVVGVAGALPLPAPAVWPHEQVRPGLLAERAAELGTGMVQPEPILLLYDGERPLAPDTDGQPLVDLAVADGHHRVDVIADPGRVAGVNAALVGSSLVVADGHHRFRVLSSLPAPPPARLRPGRRRAPLRPDRGSDPAGGTRCALGDRAVDPRRGRWWSSATGTATGSSRRSRPMACAGSWVTSPAPSDWRCRSTPPQRCDRPVGSSADGSPATSATCTAACCRRGAWPATGCTTPIRGSRRATRPRSEGGLAVESSAPRLDEVMTAARAGTLLPHKATSIAPKPRAGLLMLGDGIVPGPPARR